MNKHPINSSVVPPNGFLSLNKSLSNVKQDVLVTSDYATDKNDGSSAIEIKALFEDSVVDVRHMDNPQAGSHQQSTYFILAVGLLTVAGGVAALVSASAGFAGLLFVLGSSISFHGVTRFIAEKGSPDYVLGEGPDANLNLLHSALPRGHFPLIQSTGKDYQVLFTKEMQGDITIGAERRDIRSLIDAGYARPSANYAGAYAYAIPKNAQIMIDIGVHRFLVASVKPARKIETSFFSTMNWSNQVFNGVSFAFHALVLFIVFAIPSDGKSLTLDLFNSENTLLGHFNMPKNQKDEKIPEWLKEQMRAKQGQPGQADKGKAGKMGDQESKQNNKRYALKGDKKLTPQLAKEFARHAARDSGVLGLLKGKSGSHLASIFGKDSAIGQDADDALGNLIGDDIGEAYGVGGLSVSGNDRGGGGTGDGTVGMGDWGTIGTIGEGGDRSGYGAKKGRLTPRRSSVPTVSPGIVNVRGALDRDIIRRTIRRHIREIKHCYQKELVNDSKLGGRVVVYFMITGNGVVGTSSIKTSTLNNSTVEMCITKAVRRWSFPKPQGGGVVSVSYPFVFHAAGNN